MPATRRIKPATVTATATATATVAVARAGPNAPMEAKPIPAIAVAAPVDQPQGATTHNMPATATATAATAATATATAITTADNGNDTDADLSALWKFCRLPETLRQALPSKADRFDAKIATLDLGVEAMKDAVVQAARHCAHILSPADGDRLLAAAAININKRGIKRKASTATSGSPGRTKAKSRARGARRNPGDAPARRGRRSVLPDRVNTFIEDLLKTDNGLTPSTCLTKVRAEYPNLDDTVTDARIKARVSGVKYFMGPLVVEGGRSKRGRKSVIPDNVCGFIKQLMNDSPKISPREGLAKVRERFTSLDPIITDERIKSKISSIKVRLNRRAKQ